MPEFDIQMMPVSIMKNKMYIVSMIINFFKIFFVVVMSSSLTLFNLRVECNAIYVTINPNIGRL